MSFMKGIFFRKKDEYDCEFIISPIINFNRNTYLNLRMLIRTLFSLPLAFYLGYSLYFNISNIKDILLMFLAFCISFIISFYLLQIPHEFIHYLIYSSFFNDKSINIKLLNRKRFIIATCNSTMSKIKLFFGLITPMLIITSALCIILILKGFNIIIYSILWSNLILCSEDILNIFILITSNKSSGLYEIPNNYNYIYKE